MIPAFISSPKEDFAHIIFVISLIIFCQQSRECKYAFQLIIRVLVCNLQPHKRNVSGDFGVLDLQTGKMLTAARKSLHLDQEVMPLNERALLDAAAIADDDVTTTTTLKTPSTNTVNCCTDVVEDPEKNLWEQGFSNLSSQKHFKQLKCWQYFNRHRTFLISIVLCLLAWIIFAVVTLYTLSELQLQCRTPVSCASSSIVSVGTVPPDNNGNTSSAATTAPSTAKSTHLPSQVCTTFDCVTTAARMIGAMDFTVDPCHDFFNYACANWNKEHIIPDDRTSISTFEVMADKVQVQLRRLLEEPNTNTTVESMRKAKLMFSSCMNISEIEQIGDSPLKDIMRRFGGWPIASPPRTPWKAPENMTMEVLIALIHRDLNLVIVVDQWVGPDDKDSEKHILQIDQPDFALPSREHYVNPSWAKDLEAYQQYMIDVARVFKAPDNKDVRRQLQEALKVEINLANSSSPEAERQATRSALYNKLTLAQLQQQVPDFEWRPYFATLLGYELSDSEEIVAYGIPYLKAATTAIKKFTKQQIWNYALWRVAMEFAPHMSSSYLEARANFHKVLMGVSQQRARWQQCIDFVNDKMGMATGALFIRDHFQPESKDKALEMIHMIRNAFVELMGEQNWMVEATAAKAKEKAEGMNEKIGYPNFLLNTTRLNEEYETLVVDDADVFMINVARLYTFQTKRNFDRLKQPVDPERWTTTGPAIVNAFYNPNKNDIVFPAGILQPPFYSASYPRSMNFGGIGVVVGHEISHGFDLKGRQFDRHGNLKEWWDNVTAEAFYRKAECFVDQYSEYIVDEVGLHIDGRLTLGENIADNGGLKQAYRAYHRWIDRNGPEQMLPGSNLTHDQLFFLNYAQIWCGSMRIQDAMNKISASVHSPGPIRVLGPLSNMPEFSQAFNCPTGSRFNPPKDKKCSLW